MLGCVGIGACYADSSKPLVVFLHLPYILLGTDDELLAIAGRDAVGTVEAVHISGIIAIAQVFVIYLGGPACQFLLTWSI